MAVTSEHVIDDLAGGSLTEALAALSRAAGLIGRMGHATPDETAEFGRLDALATELAARIGKMIRSLGGVDPLAINARVVAAGIRSSSVDFSTFADDIARTLGRTRSSLHAFQTELRTVAGRIAAARSLQTAFQERRAMAASSLPARLRQTVDALASQHQRAAAASSGVRRSIDGIQARVGEAVIALQIGDITRQRLEHVQRGLILLSGTLDGPDAPEAPADAAALTATMCHLLCAQVADAAADFDRDVARVVASVDGLRSEAEALRDLAIATSGATAQGGGVADL
jgi:hypothetical protein